jgi:hypothetical protein
LKLQTDASKKYHSLAAKGETVDLSKLEEAQQANSANLAANVQQQEQQQPSNEAVNATIEHPQTVAGATMPTAQPPAAAPIARVAAGSVPASTTATTQPGAGAMPQALMNSGKHECITCDCITTGGRLTISQCKTKA